MNTSTDTSRGRNTANALQGRRIAILVSDLFEQSELQSPLEALKAAGALPHIVSDKGPQIYGLHHAQPGDAFRVDVDLAQADPASFDALVLPGGTLNADALRTNLKAHDFVRSIDEAAKPIAVICHGAWLLVSAGLVSGRTLTTWPSLQDDVRNAGGTWVDQPVVRDGNWISSRKPDDLPAFNAALIDALRSDVPTPVASVGG